MTDPALPFELTVIELGNTAFEGSNDAYLLGTEPGATTTLVDTGVAVPQTRTELREGLAEHDLTFADVERVFVTHWHQDHAGLAGEIQAAGGATVHVHAADAPLVGGDEDAHAAMQVRVEQLLGQWGMPAPAQDELLAFMGGQSGLQGDAPAVETVEDGETFDLGVTTLEAVHLPGHAAGLTGYAFDGRDGEELFSGDALLPYYTPNVGGADVRVEKPLAEYLSTLERVVDRGFTRAWPGHRGPIVDPSGRAADIVVHHRERTGRVLSYLEDDGPADAWTVSAHLFGDLSSIHILHGPGEAYAHLEHLADAGLVARHDAGGARRYEFVTAEGVADLFPDLAGLWKDPDALPGPAD